MLTLYEPNETNFNHNGLGILRYASNSKITEIQNGMFELEFTYVVGSFLYDELDYDLIIKGDASPNFKNQLFRIYYISPELDGTVEIRAQHISYDNKGNFIEKIDLKNVNCEEALETIFRKSTRSNRFKGHSNIINRQNFYVECVNTDKAIKGTKGSVIDTFGLGAKIKYDNFNVYVNQVRGESNNVLISYSKNITGFTASVDTQDVVTVIYPFAMIDNPVEGQSGQIKITLPEKYIYSKNIDIYAEYKIVPMDFTGDNVKTINQLREEANKFFYNKQDLPLTNYKVNFIDLSKTENYKDYKMLETVNMDDEVIIRVLKLGINATTRVVKTEYDPIDKKYISIELGQLINHWGNDDERLDKIEDKLDKVNDSLNNIDTNVDDSKFPNTLPDAPVASAYGLFASIMLDWTYENKTYYSYEVYASQIQNFAPDTTNYTNLLFAGQASSLLHEVKPLQTWYYKVRAVNSHGNATSFSMEISASTRKLSDAAEYFEEAAIDKALIGSLDADKIIAGKVKAQHIELREIVVVDGNKKTTFEIDSFGRLYGNFTSFEINSESIEKITSAGGVNVITNPSAAIDANGWSDNGYCEIFRYESTESPSNLKNPELHSLVPINQGLSMIIKDCDDKIIFIDGGYSANAQHCINYLKSMGVTKIDYYIASHSHSDHVEAAPAIMSAFPPDYAIIKESDWDRLPAVEIEYKTKEMYEAFVAKCKQLGTEILNPSVNNYIKLSAFSDLTIFNSDSRNYADYNHQSLMFLYRYKDNKVFLACDGTNDASLSALNQVGEVDIMLVGHHGDGSIGGSSQILIDELKPEHAIFNSDYLANNPAFIQCDLTLKRVCFHGGVAYSFGGGQHHNDDYKFVLNGTSVETTAKNTRTTNSWYDRGKDTWYYFKSNGSLARSENLTINGKIYNFDADGICTNPNT